MRLWLGLMALILCLAGCQAQAETEIESAPVPGVEITVVTSYGSDDGNRQNYLDAIAAYESATGNTVADSSATSNEDWKTKVRTDFQAGAEPDVLFYFVGADSNVLVRSNKVVSLEEIRQTYPDFAQNMDEDLLPTSPVDGQVYAIPSNGFWEGLFVNKTVLAQAGVEMPGADYTWSQFLVDCQAIQDAGFTPIAVSLAQVPHYWFEAMVLNQGTPETHIEVPQTPDDAVAQKWAAALETLKELYDAGYFPDNTLTAGDAGTVQLFAEDQAAFMLEGSWQMGYLEEHYPDKLEQFAVTYMPGSGTHEATEVIGGLSMGYYLTRLAWEDEARREAALDFISFMTSDDLVATFSPTMVTALAADSPASDDLNPMEESAVAMWEGATNVALPVQDNLRIWARDALFTSIQDVVTGKISPIDAVNQSLFP